MDIKCVTLAILCLIYISKIEIVGRDADFDGMAPKKRQCGSYKQYLGPEVEPWAEEPERSKRRRDNVSAVEGEASTSTSYSDSAHCIISSLESCQNVPAAQQKPSSSLSHPDFLNLIMPPQDSPQESFSESYSADAETEYLPMHGDMSFAPSSQLQVFAAEVPVGSSCVFTGESSSLGQTPCDSSSGEEDESQDEMEMQVEEPPSEESSRSGSPIPADQELEHEEPQGEDVDVEEVQEQQPEGNLPQHEHHQLPNEDGFPNEDQPLPEAAEDEGGLPQNHHENPTHPKLQRHMDGDYRPVIETDVGVSRNDALYMALGLARRENFSNTCLLNCINLINNLFQSPILPTTLDSLDGILLSKNSVRYFFFCIKCNKSFGELDFKNLKTYVCPNRNCRVNNIISDLRKAKFFVMFNVPLQLQNLLQNPEVLNALLTPAEAAAKGREGFTSDLWSGSMYRRFVAAVLNLAGRIVSFHFCVDGSPLAISSLCSIWPLQLILNELPPHLRMKHILLGGLWFGVKAAKMDLFLEPFVDHFRDLSAGFNIRVGNDIQFFRAFCTGCCVDSGARGQVQGIKSHSGYYSCNWCTISGQWIGHAVKFPLTDEEPLLRSHDDMERTQRNLAIDPEVVDDDEDEEPLEDPGIPADLRDLKGVKGVSPLINLPLLRNPEGELLPSFDVVKSFFVDVMHMIDLGIAKYFMTRWMEDYGHDYYIKGSEEEINARIKSLHPPLEFRKLPRVLSERARYNARENFNWTFFVSVPVLTGILPNKYLQTWLLLIQAYYFLSLTEVRNDLQNTCERLIQVFLQKTQELYHAGDMTFNLHILQHLTDHVFMHGPTWASCAYCFEDGNGRLKRLIHSNQGIPHQIIRALSWAEAMKVLEGVVSEKAKQYVSNITTPEQHRQRSISVADARLIGKSEVFNPSDAERFQFQQFGHDEDTLECYPKVIYRNCAFTDNKNRSLRHDNSVAQLNDNSLVLIRRIVYDFAQNNIFLLVSDIHFQTVLVPPPGVRIQREDHFMRRITHINEEIKYVKCQDLKIICFRATLPSGDFVAPFPNVHNRQ